MKRLIIIVIFILFIPLLVNGAIKGDVDSNGTVNTVDYLLIVRHMLNINKLTGSKLTNADVNGDGKINTLDYVEIRKIILSGNSQNSTAKKVSITISKGTCEAVLTAKVDSSIKLASNPYSWDSKKTWTNSKTLTVDKEKSYRLYVKDTSGNIYYSDLYTVVDIVPTKLKSGIISSSEFNITKGIGSNITNAIAQQNTRNFNKALQCAHNNGITSLKVENGKYYFGRVKGEPYISINFSNLTLDLNSSEFHVYPNNIAGYRLMQIGNLSPLEDDGDIHNVTVKNGTLYGDRYQHKCSVGTWTCGKYGFECSSEERRQTHENGHGIAITANDARIERVKIYDMIGDGIYIYNNFNNTKSNYQVYVYKNVIENNRRQGISIIYGKNIVIKDNTIRYTNGTSPQAGIDIERNNETEFYKDITIDGNTIYGNNSRISIYICPGIKGYLKITNNKFGDQVLYNWAETRDKEKSKVTIKGNTSFTPSGVENCVCNPNVIYADRTTECIKCQKKKCIGKVVNGTVQKQ